MLCVISTACVNVARFFLRADAAAACHTSVAAGSPFSAPGQLPGREPLLLLSRAHGVPGVIVGEALQAHYASLRKKCRYLPDSVTALVVSAEGCCFQSGGGVFVVRCLLRGDTGAWPTQI